MAIYIACSLPRAIFQVNLGKPVAMLIRYDLVNDIC